MLGTLLEKLGTLLPKNFLIAIFLPMLLFASANGAMLYWTSADFREWGQRVFAFDAGEQALVGFALLVALTLSAYIFSTLNLFLRQVLEGEYLGLQLKGRLIAGQQRRLDEKEKVRKDARKQRRKLRRVAEPWILKLKQARAEGEKKDALCDYPEGNSTSEKVAELSGKKGRHESIDLNKLEEAVELLIKDLEKSSVDQRKPEAPDLQDKLRLAGDHNALYEVIYFALSYAENEYSASFNDKEFNYSSYKLAPTSMGNIAESVRGYARSRYSLNLDPFWLRMQKIIQSDEQFYAVLLDAKTQLDFLISLFWLTALFTTIWVIALVAWRGSLVLFLVIGIGGPLLLVLWYRIALQNYQAFADLLRASIDLYRLKLLDALHIRLPNGTAQERQIWTDLNQIIGFGDDETKVSYKHPE